MHVHLLIYLVTIAGNWRLPFNWKRPPWSFFAVRYVNDAVFHDQDCCSSNNDELKIKTKNRELETVSWCPKKKKKKFLHSFPTLGSNQNDRKPIYWVLVYKWNIFFFFHVAKYVNKIFHVYSVMGKLDDSVVDGFSVNQKRCLGRARCPSCFELGSRARTLGLIEGSQTDFSVALPENLWATLRVAQFVPIFTTDAVKSLAVNNLDHLSAFATGNLQRRLRRREDEWSPNFSEY